MPAIYMDVQQFEIEFALEIAKARKHFEYVRDGFEYGENSIYQKAASYLAEILLIKRLGRQISLFNQMQTGVNTDEYLRSLNIGYNFTIGSYDNGYDLSIDNEVYFDVKSYGTKIISRDKMQRLSLMVNQEQYEKISQNCMLRDKLFYIQAFNVGEETTINNEAALRRIEAVYYYGCYKYTDISEQDYKSGCGRTPCYKISCSRLMDFEHFIRCYGYQDSQTIQNAFSLIFGSYGI